MESTSRVNKKKIKTLIPTKWVRHKNNKDRKNTNEL